MPVKIRIPTSLTYLTDGKKLIEFNTTSISDCLSILEKQFPGIKDKIAKENINIYVNGNNIRYLQGMDTFLKEGDEISIIPAIAGG